MHNSISDMLLCSVIFVLWCAEKGPCLVFKCMSKFEIYIIDRALMDQLLYLMP